MDAERLVAAAKTDLTELRTLLARLHDDDGNPAFTPAEIDDLLALALTGRL